jgi:hypothetical protein
MSTTPDAIWETAEWAALKAHLAGEIEGTHLRDLMLVRVVGLRGGRF